MALWTSDDDLARAPSVSAGGAKGLLATLAIADSSFAALVMLAGLPLLAAAWALLSPAHVLSRTMTWDLLFNLSGAWHLHFGHVPHVDYHDPVGRLDFLLTVAGFHFVGPSPRAVLVGMTIMAAALFAAACFVSWRRLPLLPAAVFVVFCCLLAMMPANVGEPPNAYSFAMSYNQYGWALLSVLALLLFLPPRNGRRGDVADIVIAGALLLAMFYLKITYFVVGLAALPLALAFCPHVCARWPGWAAVGLLAAANVAAPYNRPYLLDLLAVAEAGGIRDKFVIQLMRYFTDLAQPAVYVAGFAAAAWVWWRGYAPLRLPIAAAYLIGSGACLLSQNAQLGGIPLAMVIAFLLYDAFRQRFAGERFDGMAVPLLVLLVFPLSYIGTSALSLAAYRFNAGSEKAVRVVDHTNLKGLAVPAEEDGLLAAFAAGNGGYELLNRSRVVYPQFELTPFEYVGTIVEAADLMAGKRYLRGGIVVLDQVNPMPFTLGLPPTRGAALWLGKPFPPPDQLFADVDYVLIPKFSTDSLATKALAATYASHLKEHFRHIEESPSWFLLSREDSADQYKPQVPIRLALPT